MKKRTTKRKAKAPVVKQLSPLKQAIAARDFKAELKRIVTFLNEGDMQATNLWSVLTALRGPDLHQPGYAAKSATTAVIRCAVGLRSYVLPASVKFDTAEAVITRKVSEARNFALTIKPLISEHFDQHAREAFEALGLKWTELNEPEVKI